MSSLQLADTACTFLPTDHSCICMGGMEGGVVEQPTGVVWHLLQSIERALPTVWMPQLVHACLADDSGSVPAWHTTALTVVTLAGV